MPRACSMPLYSVLLAFVLTVFSRAATPPPWMEIRSPHFIVITDAGDKKGREVALRFEQMRAVFADLLAKDRLHQSIPLTILALKDDKAYYQAAPLRQGRPIDVPGFFLTGEDQDFIVLNVSEAEPWRAVAHDFGLMLLNYNYPPAQGWFDEGLAEYFSSIHIEGKQVEMGGDPQLQAAGGQGLAGDQGDVHPRKSLTELLGTQAWIPLPDLFTMKHDPLRDNKGSDQGMYEAESWAVMSYLIHQKKLPETGTYLGLVLGQHVPVEDAIKQAYGMGSAQLEQDVKDYFQSQTRLGTAVEPASRTNPGATNDANSRQIDRFPIPGGADESVLVANPMSDPDAHAIYAGIETRIAERREVGLKTLKELATTPTEADKKSEARTKRTGEDDEQLPSNAVGNALAHRFLAWDDIQHGQFQEAFEEIGDAAALNPRDMWTRYYFSVAKYRMSLVKHDSIVGLSNMLLDLKAVLEWTPEMASAYDLLAVARNAGGTQAAAMQAERAAMTLSPRDQRFVYHMAEIYVASKKWEAAFALLDRLKSSDDPQIAAQAQALLSESAAERKYGVALTSGAGQPKYEAQKTPFDVLDEDAATRAAAEKADPSAGTADSRPTKFLTGRLLAVDCSKAPGATLTVTSGAGVLKLRTGDYKSLLLIGADDFSCEWRDRQVTVNYKPAKGSEGDLVSLELR